MRKISLTSEKTTPGFACDAIVLAGGKGTRLAPVISHVPKPLAPVFERPFLDYLIDHLAGSGAVSRIVLALGHLSDKVVQHYQANPAALPLDYSIEAEPLGTGGALLHALDQVESDAVLVCNGDSIVAADIFKLLDQHRASGAAATLTLVTVSDVARYGSVHVQGNHITKLVEKSARGGFGFINAGLYVFKKARLSEFASGPCSLERDLLPRMVDAGEVRAFMANGPFLDIGLPETYSAAEKFFDDWHATE